MTIARPSTTRERILEAALDLFNRKGSVDVTTHDVAAACGISPGNLYYHFRNKEDIVRALFDQSLETHRRRETTGRDPGAGRTLEDDLAFLKEFNWRYRFFKRELPTLLQRDRALRQAFLAFQQEHLDRLEAGIRDAVACGDLRALDAPGRRALAELSWMVILFWPSFVELGGRLTRSDMDRGIDLVQWLFASQAARPPAARARARSRAS